MKSSNITFSNGFQRLSSVYILLLCVVCCCISPGCRQTADHPTATALQQPGETKGASTDFDISGYYIAGYYGSSQYDYYNQTGLFPNTFPKAAVRLEVLQLYPNWREITVKLAARFYDKQTSNSGWAYKGRVLGMGTGTLTVYSSTGYQVAFEISDVNTYFIDATELTTSAPLKFVFNGKISQFSTFESSEDPLTPNLFLAMTGTMTITDTQHKVYSSTTTSRLMAAKRWLGESFQPF